MGLIVREATEDDIDRVRDIFLAVYAGDYPYDTFTDPRWLKRSVFNDDILMLVAADEHTGDVVGTASVVFDLGAHSDLLAEFGRLAVHPEARGRGVGNLLMRKRCEYIANRLHVGMAQNRCVHPYSQRISKAHGFAAVGFLPMKYEFTQRESVALWVRHFGPALALRRNHPRIVPEAHALATLALEGCGLHADAIVDEESAPYPPGGHWLYEELTDRGLPALMRIERGRVRNREVFGPMRLQYGFFQLTARHATYLVARDPESRAVAGAVGYIHDEGNAGVHVFELIAREEQVSRPLLEAFLQRCHDWSVQFVEIDVSAHAPRMQRTLVELGFLPAGYVPAMVFHDVERLDVVKMVKLMRDLDLGEIALIPETQIIADLVTRSFATQAVVPRIAQAMACIELFRDLTPEQATRVAGVCAVRELAAGARLFGPGDDAEEILVPIEGTCAVRSGGVVVGHVGPGEVLGEVAALLGEAHSAEATTADPAVLAALTRADLAELTRQRPDIAVVLYRNLATGLGHKLRRADRTLAPPGAVD